MVRLRLVGLCLVVLCLAGAVALASVLATAPEYGRCEKAAKPNGK